MTALEALTAPHQAKLTVEDFVALDRMGAFSNYSKSELIDGTIYVVNAQHQRHSRIKGRFAFVLGDALKVMSDLEVLVETGVEMRDSVAEPDIIIMDATDGDGFVPVGSVRLAAEIADTSLGFDLGLKALLYASSAIPEYWVIDIKGPKIQQFWSPKAEGYAERREIPRGEAITAMTLPGLAIDTAGI